MAHVSNMTLIHFEDVPDVSNEETAIQKTLSTVGVYSHKNDEILASSKIEEARVLNALKVRVHTSTLDIA